MAILSFFGEIQLLTTVSGVEPLRIMSGAGILLIRLIFLIWVGVEILLKVEKSGFCAIYRLTIRL